jgi:hypothetical protein
MEGGNPQASRGHRDIAVIAVHDGTPGAALAAAQQPPLGGPRPTVAVITEQERSFTK